MTKLHPSTLRPDAKVGPALYIFAGIHAKDAQTLRSIIKKLFPETEAMGAEFQSYLNQLALTDLVGKLIPGEAKWRPEVEEELLTRCPATDTYLRAYPRCVKRFADFVMAAGLLIDTAPLLLPEWEDFLDKAFSLMPQNKAELKALAASGATRILGRYAIEHDNLKATNTKIQNVRSAIRTMARNASVEGLTPQAFAEEFLAGPREDEVGRIAGNHIYGSYCRWGWNAVAETYSELDLPIWPDRRNIFAIPVDEWPEPLRVGVTQGLLERPGSHLKPNTLKSYRQILGAFAGVLDREGIQIGPLVDDLNPQEAVRLIFQGWPREHLTGDPAQDAPLVLQQKLISEPEFKQAVLDSMQKLGTKAGERHLVDNPFVALVLEDRYANNSFASARSMLCRIYTLNIEHLGISDANLKWLKARLNEVEALKANQETPTPIEAKKQVVFKHPMLFKSLMKAAKSLYDSLDERYKTHGPWWATSVRDLTYFSLVTIYPLRVKNYQGLKLGENYDPINHTIQIDRREVKNRKPIDLELPAKGAYAWVRELVDLYLSEARPILLRGAQSHHFFVGNLQTPNANGFLNRRAFNDILIELSKKHLHTVLPPQLGYLNPHLFRHIAATYQVAHCNNPTRAALLLNDKVETVLKHYADILGAARGACKDFFEESEE